MMPGGVDDKRARETQACQPERGPTVPIHRAGPLVDPLPPGGSEALQFLTGLLTDKATLLSFEVCWPSRAAPKRPDKARILEEWTMEPLTPTTLSSSMRLLIVAAVAAEVVILVSFGF